MNKDRIIVAVRTEEDFLLALKSRANTVFLFYPNILTLSKYTKLAHDEGKKLFVHIDFAQGFGRDEYGLIYIKNQGVDGIISTRTNIIKLAKSLGICTVQRFFAVDSQSVDSAVEGCKSSKADMIEIMPGTVAKVINWLKGKVDMPIIAGGLIETAEEVEISLKSGAYAVSTGNKYLWELELE